MLFQKAIGQAWHGRVDKVKMNEWSVHQVGESKSFSSKGYGWLAYKIIGVVFSNFSVAMKTWKISKLFVTVTIKMKGID